MPNSRRQQPDLVAPPAPRPWWLLVAGVVGLAFAFRFFRLVDMPPGLHYDEAFNGLDVAALLDTPLFEWPIFFTGNFGREPLFNYILAGATALFGPGLMTLRLVSALVGALLTPALMWLAWEMAPALGAERRRLAPWAGLAIVALLWTQIFARQALRVEFFALLEILFFAALWRAWRGNTARWWVATGALLGLSLYTYLPARLLPLIPAGVALLFAWRDRARMVQRRKGMALAVLATGVVALPLGVYFMQNPLSFSTRLGQVSVLEQGVAAIWGNVWATIQMVAVAGDANPRANLSGRPVFDLALLAPFVVGLLYLLRHVLWPAATFLLVWLGVMLLPTVLSEYAPSFQRAIGAMPVFALMAALGLERAVAWGAARWPQRDRLLALAGWALLLLSVAITWRDFARWSASPDLFFAATWASCGWPGSWRRMKAPRRSMSARAARITPRCAICCSTTPRHPMCAASMAAFVCACLRAARHASSSCRSRIAAVPGSCRAICLTAALEP